MARTQEKKQQKKIMSLFISCLLSWGATLSFHWDSLSLAFLNFSSSSRSSACRLCCLSETSCG